MATQVFAGQLNKPYLVVPLDAGVSPEMGVAVLAWLRDHDIQILNIAGPRESKRPGIHRLTCELLEMIDSSI